MAPEKQPQPGSALAAAILAMGIASAFALGYVEARQIDARHPVVQGRFRDPIGRAAITALDGLALSLPFLLASSILGTIRKPSRRKDAALAAIVVAGLGALGLASRRAAAALPQFSAAGPPARGDRPSILLVTIDTLRQDHVSAYGSSPVQTPTLDAIAREGTLFERAYSQAPLTTPSHASLLSGLDPPRHGSRYNMVPAKLSANALAPVLKKEGYDTAAFVSVVILDREKSGLGVGFDTYEELLVPDPVSQQIYLATPARIALSLLKRHPPERRARATIERACAYLAARPASAAPLFLWVHLYDPHVPYRPPSMFRDQADPAYRGAFEVNKETVVALREGKLSLSERDLEHGRRMYQAEVAYADSCLGQLVLAVKKMPGSWITVATADHGESLGEHKYTFFHGENLHGPSMHVPLMIAGPGIPKGLHVPWLVRLVDVMPTLLDLAAVPVPDGLDGQSLAPALAGKGTPALASYGEDGDQLYFVVSPGNRLEHKDVGLRTESHSYVLRPSSGAEELYDLRSDPGETRNVAAEPDQAEAKARLKDELAKITDLGSYGGAPPLDDDEARKALEQLGYVSPGAPRTSPPATPKGH